MASRPFQLVSEFKPMGDQPQAIAALVGGLHAGRRYQTLEGVTGSGKTFTLANVIAQWGRPTLLISHNKTLAAQLYGELKGFFPENAVEYFVSYYDYYQPEAYIPQTDTYIEKDSAINEEIERLRLAATNALINRQDVIVVATVSCIYGLGSPQDYREMLVNVRRGETLDRDEVLRRLVDIQYERNDIEPRPGVFRARGDTLDVFPSHDKDNAFRIEWFGDQIDRIILMDPLTGAARAELEYALITPAKHFVMPPERIAAAGDRIRRELEERVAYFERAGKWIEAQRIRMRTTYDLEMMRELGYCPGIENYSRQLEGRPPHSRPSCLLDFFPGDFLTLIDESHVTVPQIRGMFNGDQARKRTLVEHGFRLPSAMDNRPMTYDEFFAATGPVIYVSATPAPYEQQLSNGRVPQLIRPTGILDPLVEVRPLKNQVDDLIHEIRVRAERQERVLVTTLTKRTAEELSTYLQELGMRVQYLHSEIDAIERVEILRGLRKSEFDVLVGINLLREGLDLPEVSLVAVLDADKEGFLRSETSLIQTAGRAARHVDGRVLLYADHITDSMRRMLDRTRERRTRQEAYNREHHITPKAIQKSIQESLSQEYAIRNNVEERVVREAGEDVDIQHMVATLEREMLEAADALEFERAALLRDQMEALKSAPPGTPAPKKSGSDGRRAHTPTRRPGRRKRR